MLDVQVKPGIGGFEGIQQLTIQDYRPDDTTAPTYLNRGFPELVAPGTFATTNDGLVPVVAVNCSGVPGCHLDGVQITAAAEFGGSTRKASPAIRLYGWGAPGHDCGTVNSVTIESSQLTGSVDVLNDLNVPAGEWVSRSAGGFTFVGSLPTPATNRSIAAQLTAGGHSSTGSTRVHAILSGVSGESNARFALDSDGSLHWGNGASAQFHTTMETVRSATSMLPELLVPARGVKSSTLHLPAPAASGDVNTTTMSTCEAVHDGLSDGGLVMVEMTCRVADVDGTESVLVFARNHGNSAVSVPAGRALVVVKQYVVGVPPQQLKSDDTQALAWSLAPTGSFGGKYFSGEGDTEFLGLLDLGRRQYSSAEYEYQSVNMLYKGTFDGLLEGPTWGAWWTQNSYGTTMTSLPFMEDATWHATQQSMAWWFDSIGDGKKLDGTFHTTHGSWIATDGSPVAKPGPPVPAPDGALCDAAVPCGPAKNCCAYKQGDGVVPRHDWTFEETLSGVVMQAEQLLVAHNKTGVKHFLPLFMRTSGMLEQRRDPRTQNTTFLTGVGSNLLAPSFGGGPNGSMSHLTGVSVTYAAALDRVIECALLVEDKDTAAELAVRKALTMEGLRTVFLSPNKKYFVRSHDPDGTLHGVLGQRPKHGYFEASCNHDAVALRVVDDELSENIMATIDELGPLIRPNHFLLPNSDAQDKPAAAGSNATGYDDMLCGDGATCDHQDPSHDHGLWSFGKWVNGGVWTTTEARAIMAYYRTGRSSLVSASMKQMTTLYTKQWKLDNPLIDFGLGTYVKALPLCFHNVKCVSKAVPFVAVLQVPVTPNNGHD